jgi:hypothetical protein
VEAYRCKFEELRLLMLRANPTHDEAYFKESSLSGLKEELIIKVLGTRPRTLKEVYDAPLYEESLAELKRKHKLKSKAYAVPNSKPTQFNKNFATKASQPTFKGTKEEKKCFTCHAPWAPGHKCSSKAVNAVEAMMAAEEAWPTDSEDGLEEEAYEPSQI